MFHVPSERTQRRLLGFGRGGGGFAGDADVMTGLKVARKPRATGTNAAEVEECRFMLWGVRKAVLVCDAEQRCSRVMRRIAHIYSEDTKHLVRVRLVKVVGI